MSSSEKKKIITQRIEAREISTEMQESYLDYAMSVIVSRALPDVRDGLKPVQRRILFAMWEDGLKAGTKFKKCAAVIGSVLSRYHPHGDMAVYGALARMAQHFSLRYPLVEGQGNFGSIDGDSPAAYRYCLTGDALVVTNHGLEKIREITAKENVSRKVLSFNGKIYPVSKWFDSGLHPVKRLKTFRGYRLEGTLNHPLLVLEKGSQGQPVFNWKQLSEVRKGEFAVIDRNDKALWPSSEPSLKEFCPDIKNQRAKLYSLPSKMSPALAFIMGAITAEGYISASKKSSKWKIGFCNTDAEFIKEFKEKFREVFPEVHIYQQERKPSGYGKKNYISLEIGSLQLSQFLQNLGLKAVRARRKSVPHILFRATKESVATFLRGFVEGDGSIFLPSSRGGPRIVFISASQQLLQEIQLLLLRFGIVVFLREDRCRGTWILWTGGRNNLQLFKAIGFVSQKKQKRLEDYCQIDKEDHAISKTDFIPFLSDFLREKYRKKEIKWVFKEWLIKHNLDRYSKLKKYYPVLEKFLEKEDLKLIKSFLNQNYLFDKIVSVRKSGRAKVYSPKVESQCHSFVANGFVNHNTESRLSPIGEIMLQDIDKDTVDFIPNYDGTHREPVVLPSPLPQLLLNGTLGIAVGMATDIPPHNAQELGEALIYLVDHPQATTIDLLQFVQGPDFPTRGIIYGKENIVEAYSQGRGSVIIRGKAEVVEEKGKLRIIISEIPYRVNKSNLVRRMAELIINKKLKGVRTIRDESDREGIRVVVELSSAVNPQRVLNQLYKYTDLQTSFHLNMVALVNGIQPETLSLVEMLNYYLEHRQEIIVRRTKFELARYQARRHILDGLVIALDNIDEIIATIKKSKDKADAQKNLIKKFKFSVLQADAILEIKLHRLARLERQAIEDELKQIKLRIKELKKILSSSLEVQKVMKKEIQEAVKKYGDARKTKVIKHNIKELSQEDLIPLEESFIVLTSRGYIKRMKPENYHSQHRGGKGILGVKVMEGDVVTHLIAVSTRDRLLLFTNLGKVYELPVYEIEEASRTSQGKNIANYLALDVGEQVLAIINEKTDSQRRYLIMVSEKGLIKKTAKEKYQHIRQNGLRAITLRPGDALKAVAETSGEDIIVLVSKKGKTIVFPEKGVRSMGRVAKGLKGFSLGTDDQVISLGVAPKGQKKNLSLLVLSQKGFAKKTALGKYRSQRRGGKGILTAKLNKKTGNLIFAKLLKAEEELVIISAKGQVIRQKTSRLPQLSRSTSGVKAMRLKAGDQVATAVCLPGK